MHNVRAVSFICFHRLIEDYSPGDSLSDTSEELIQRDKGGGARICEFFLLEKNIHKHQKTTANHKKYTFQVKIFNVFLWIGRYKNLSSLKLFFRCAS